MRIICRFKEQSHARIFGGYLLSEGVTNELELSQEDEWLVWVHSEEHLERAKELHQKYLDDPENQEIQLAAVKALEAAHKKTRQKSRYRRINPRDRWLAMDRPKAYLLTLILMGVSVLVGMITGLGSNHDTIVKFTITEYEITPRGEYVQIKYLKGLPEVTNGHFWRLLTPMFLHFGIIHLVFNMLWLLDLGRMVETRQGKLRLILLVIVISAASNIGQYMVSGPNFGGMSGVVYGLLGYVWLRGKFDPSSGLYLDRRTVMFMIVWFFLCLFNVFPGVANTAHAVGLGLGMAWGYVSAYVRRA